MMRARVGIIVIAAASMLTQEATAEAPFEKYHVSRSSISAAILRHAIGVLTITSGIKRGTQVQAYKNEHHAWASERTIRVIDTKPVSNFGYHPQQLSENASSGISALSVIQGIKSNSRDAPDDISNYRFPILEKSGEFLRIAINPVQDLRVWVSTTDIEKSFIFEQAYFSDLTKLAESSVDPCFGVKIGTRLIYKKPNLAADAFEISCGRLFSVMAGKDGFIQLGQTVGSEESPRKESIGWIPIRDADGLLTIWIALADNC